MTQRLVLILSAMLSLMPPTSANAQDGNYQTYVIGNRAMGMGGAFTAFGDDPGGEFYNPAGIALLEGFSGSYSQSVYSFQRRALNNAVSPGDEDISGADLTDTKIPVIPAALSLAFKFGDKVQDVKRFTAGYSMFVPYLNDFSFKGILDYETSNGTARQIRLDLIDKDRTLQHGPTFAARLNSKWSVGASIFHLYRTVENLTTGYNVNVPDENLLTDRVRSVSSLVKRKIHSLLFKLGARYDPTRNWRLGLAVTPPSVRLMGEGSIDLTNISAGDLANCTGDCSRFRTVIASGDKADSQLPMQVRLGAGYTTDEKDFTTAIDISIHTPWSYYPFDPAAADEFRPDPDTGDLAAGYAVVDEINRSMVVNVNVGAEYFLGDWLFRGGFYTNFSAAETITQRAFAMPADVDMYGVSLAVGHRWGTTLVSVGAIYAFGSGHVSGLKPPPAGVPPENIFGPRGERRDYVFLFLQGASVAAKEATSYAKDLVMGSDEEGVAEEAPANAPAEAPEPAAEAPEPAAEAPEPATEDTSTESP